MSIFIVNRLSALKSAPVFQRDILFLCLGSVELPRPVDLNGIPVAEHVVIDTERPDPHAV